MLTRRIIPCLDIRDGRVVKGIRFQNLRDSGDPVERALAYAAAGADELVSILKRTTGAETPTAGSVATGQAIVDMRQTVRQIEVASAVTKYIADIVLATSPTSDLAPAAAKKYVRYGSSPRGAQSILLAAKVRAVINGRANVAMSDVKKTAHAALRHRLILSFEGQADSITTDDIIEEVLSAVTE